MKYHYDDITGNRRVSQVGVIPTINGSWRYDGPDGTRLALASTAADLASIIRDRQREGAGPSEYYPPLDQLPISGDFATPERRAEWATAIAERSAE